MKDFFSTFTKSIWSRSGYQESGFIAESKGESFKYFYSLVLALALISTIITSFQVIPLIREFTSGSLRSFTAEFPNELEVRIKKGIATTNVREPYAVPLSNHIATSSAQVTKILPDGKTDVINSFAIDTKMTTDVLSMRKFESYRTYFLLTKDSVVYKGNNGRITIEPLYKLPDITVNKTNVARWVNDIQPIFSFTPAIAAIGIFIGAIILYSFLLIYILLLALLVMLIGRLRDIKLRYGEAYRASLHAITLPLILQLILYKFIGIPFGILIFTLVFLIVAIANLREPEQAQA